MTMKIKRLINKIICRIRGHKWRVGGWETVCDRCEAVAIDRLWQTHGDEHCRSVTRAMIALSKAERHRQK